MKYQALKKLKTKTKLLQLCDTLNEAHEVIKANGGQFKEYSFIGGFPTYVNEANNRYYQIQGYHEDLKIVLGLKDEELAAFDFTA